MFLLYDTYCDNITEVDNRESRLCFPFKSVDFCSVRQLNYWRPFLILLGLNSSFVRAGAFQYCFLFYGMALGLQVVFLTPEVWPPWGLHWRPVLSGKIFLSWVSWDWPSPSTAHRLGFSIHSAPQQPYTSSPMEHYLVCSLKPLAKDLWQILL